VILITTVDDDRATVRFAYDPTAVAIMKSVPVHRWDPVHKQWTTETGWVELLAKRFHDKRFLVSVDGELWTPPDPAKFAPPILALFDALPARLRNPAYKALSKVLHPDAGGDTELMKQLNEANRQQSEHRTVGQQNGWLVCSCGHREATVWGMSVHRKRATGQDVGTTDV
jgi:hypothetical protein